MSLLCSFITLVAFFFKMWNIVVKQHVPAILPNSIIQLELKSWWHWSKTAISIPFFSYPALFLWLLDKLKRTFLYHFRLSPSLPPAAIGSHESRLFSHPDRLLCHIIGGFLWALALKVCPLLSALMRKWAALHWYVPEQQWKFNVLSVNNTQHSQMCTLIKISALRLCLCALFFSCSLQNWIFLGRACVVLQY